MIGHGKCLLVRSIVTPRAVRLRTHVRIVSTLISGLLIRISSFRVC
jgi:hypothetical protein